MLFSQSHGACRRVPTPAGAKHQASAHIVVRHACFRGLHLWAAWRTEAARELVARVASSTTPLQCPNRALGCVMLYIYILDIRIGRDWTQGQSGLGASPVHPLACAGIQFGYTLVASLVTRDA